MNKSVHDCCLPSVGLKRKEKITLVYIAIGTFSITDANLDKIKTQVELRFSSPKRLIKLIGVGLKFEGYGLELLEDLFLIAEKRRS